MYIQWDRKCQPVNIEQGERVQNTWIWLLVVVYIHQHQYTETLILFAKKKREFLFQISNPDNRQSDLLEFSLFRIFFPGYVLLLQKIFYNCWFDFFYLPLIEGKLVYFFFFTFFNEILLYLLLYILQILYILLLL